MGEYQHVLLPLSPVNDGNGRFEAVVTAKPDSQFMLAAEDAVNYRKSVDAIPSDDPMHGKIDVKLCHSAKGKELTLPVLTEDTARTLHDKFTRQRIGSAESVQR